MRKIFAILLVLCCSLPVMAKKRQNEEIITPVTQLEKRQFQTKTYPAADGTLAMKSILNVLQDEGFIVYNVNSLLGYIYGVKDFDISDPNIDIGQEFGVTKSRLKYNGVKVATLEVSVNVTQYGEQSRIRANFRRKLLNEYGNAQMIEDIDDGQYYEDFYAKVDGAVTLQKQIAGELKKEETFVEKKVDVIENAPSSEEIKTVEIKNDVNEETLVKEIKQEPVKEPKTEPAIREAVYTSEQTLDSIPTDIEPEITKSQKEQEKERKELIKQAKYDAKQAKKSARQKQKEILKAEKQAQKAKKETLKQAKKEEKRKAKEIVE